MKCDINLYAEKRNFTQKLEKREWSEFSKREYPENFGSRFDNLKRNLTLGLELSMPCGALDMMIRGKFLRFLLGLRLGGEEDNFVFDHIIHLSEYTRVS